MIVVAAVIEQEGRFLVTRRGDSSHLAGYWEFPGGKCEPGETHEQSLKREIREELNVDVKVEEKLLVTNYQYEDRHVRLYFYKCVVSGQPTPVLGQELQWASREELSRLRFPPADATLLKKLIGPRDCEPPTREAGG